MGVSERPRALVFGEVAEVYESARPGYAPRLAPVVLEYAALRGLGAVEFGAGTGKATLGFAERGVALLCVEPDPRMAEVLRRRTAGHPSVRVEVESFERWRPAERCGLLLAATCWHWFDPALRWDLAHAALAPGGTLALCWNVLRVRDEELHARLAEVDRRFGCTASPHAELVRPEGELPGSWDTGEWPAAECRTDGRFADLREVRLREETRYDTRTYLNYLSTVSYYRLLPERRRVRLFEALADVVDGHGGTLAFELATDLFLARKR